MNTTNFTNLSALNSTLNLFKSGNYSNYDLTQIFAMQTIGICISLAYILGFLLNVVATSVFIRSKKTLATEYILAFLTFADCISMLSGFVLSVFYTLMAFSVIDADLITLRNIISRTDIVLYIGPYSLTFLVSVERVHAVYKPLRFRLMWTPYMGKLVSTIVYCSTIVIGILFATLLVKEKFLFARLVFLFLCVMCVVGSNVLTIYGFKRMSYKIIPLQTLRVSSLLTREKINTQVLLGISGLFVVCGSATIADTYLSMLHIGDFEFAFQLFMSGSVRALFQIIYSTFNCTIFFLANKNLRNVFFNTLICKFKSTV